MSLRPHLPSHAEDTIHQFLRAQVTEAEAAGIVVGLSGGIDSALTARLVRDALGPDRTHGLLLPDHNVPPDLIHETEEYGRSLEIEVRTLHINAAEAAVRELFPEVHDRVTLGNVMTRLRMLALYTYAREHRLLVGGTGNKSEILMGYFTKYGDGGVDLLPLGDLYKTEVFELAEKLALPPSIQARPPSAGFWEGQTDEGELGITYARLDLILLGIEELLTTAEIADRTGEGVDLVTSLADRVARQRHKRRLPPIPKLSLRTIGLDWRD